MKVNLSVRDPEHPRQVTIAASNPAVSQQTGWPTGFWSAELSHTLVEGKTWTGLASSEEDSAGADVQQKLQPFRIEDEVRRIANANFIVGPGFATHAVRDGALITGQRQYSGAAAARLMIEAVGV